MPLLLMDSALADVLALEAVRVFLPDVFEHLRGGVDGLSSESAMNSPTEGLMDGDKQKAQTNIELAKDLANVSTVLYTVSENAGALYARYVDGVEKLAQVGLKAVTDCVDILKKGKKTASTP
jgi:hypothetical protein